MSFKNCIAILNSDKAFDRLSQSEKEDILKELANETKKMRAELKAEDFEIALSKYIMGATEDAEIKAIIKKRNELLSILTDRKHRAFAENFKDKFEGIASFIRGTIKLRASGNHSVDNLVKASFQERQAVLIKLLEDADVLEEFISRKIDLDIFKELYEMHPGGKPGISKNPTAEKIARIITQIMGEDIDTANRWGAWIIKRKGYIMRQTHSPYKLEKAGFDAWYRQIAALVDMEQTTKNVAPGNEKKFWIGVYNSLVTGNHLKFDQPSDLIEAGFTGPSNLARRVSSAHRMIVFKDAEAAYRYNQEYGMGDLRETVTLSIMHMNRNISLLQTLGPNPRAALKKWIDRSMRETKKELEAKPGDKKLIKQLRKLEEANTSEMNHIWYAFKDVSGETQIPGNVTAAMWVHSILNVQNMAKLGGATITSFADSPQVAKELAHHGLGAMNGYGITLQNIFKARGLKGSERKAVIQMMGVGMDGIIGNYISRFHSGDMIPGMWSKLQQQFFKMNLLSRWTDSHDAGIAFALSNWLAHNAQKSWKDIDPMLRTRLFEHGISNHEWDIIYKNSIWTHSETKNKFIVSDRFREIPDDLISQYIKAAMPEVKTISNALIARTRDEIINRNRTYIRHAVDRGVPKPGAWERSVMQRGTTAGSMVGGGLRFLFQFKSFPLTVIHKNLGREIYGHGAETLGEAFFKGKGNLMGLAHLIVAMSVMGYISLSLMDLLRGKETRKFGEDWEKNVQLMMASMAKGGGLGLYGDFLFGQFNRYGRSPTHTALGPTLGQFDDFWHLYSLAFQQGEFGKALNQFTKIVQGNTPFINLFYLRMVMDYFILYNIMELQSPGALKRMESRMKKNKNQQFYISPSRVIPRGGSIDVGKILSNMFKEARK